MSRSARSSRAAWTATRTGPGPGTGVFVRRYSRHITIGSAGVTPADRTGSKKQKNEQIIMTARASVIHVIDACKTGSCCIFLDAFKSTLNSAGLWI